MDSKKTVRSIEKDLKGLRVLLRVDWNVPGDPKGALTDDFRIKKSLKTIKYLQELGCGIVIISHRGRPEGKVNPEFSLKPAAERAAELLGQEIQFVDDCINDEAYKKSVLTRPGQITVLENLRFHGEEKRNDEDFAKRLSMMGDVFVQDGFGVVHREHASTEGITHWVASIGGLLLEEEVDTITAAVESPEHPFVVVIGGAKISDKIEMVKRFLDIADTVIIGGAMANTFMKAQGKEIGKSVYEEEAVSLAKELLGNFHSAELMLMTDAGVGVSSHLSKHAERRNVGVDEVGKQDMILDVQVSQEVIAKLQAAKTIIWNGTLGYAEYPQFAEGSSKVAEVIAQSGAHSIIGGGDTASFVVKWDQKQGDSFGHVSTGGGASLELMSGKELPGVKALLDK